jgi:hypothetical protein
MAHDNTDSEYVSSAQDYKDHEATYGGFTNMVKWAIVALAVLVVFLYIVIRP